MGTDYFINKAKVTHKEKFIGDHKILEIKITDKKIKLGKNQWKLNPEILNVNDIEEKIKEHIYNKEIRNIRIDKI